jgi:2-dehydropantoate 2-reductase
MRLLVLGAGAIGGYFGGRLAEAGADVTFLVRPERAAKLAAAGLVVRSPFGDIARPVATVTQATDAYDAVLLSCKAYDLASAIEAVAPAKRALVVPLLNGLAHLDALDETLGRARVAGGACYIAATLWQDGEIRHLNQIHRIAFGPREEGQRPTLDALAQACGRARFETQNRADIIQTMWDKFVFLTTLAAMTCLMRANVGQIVATADGEALTRSCLDECRAAAAAAGYPMTDASHAEASAMLTARGSTFTSSMLRDLESGGRIEADHIVGDMVRRAQAAGVAAPLLRAAYVHLQAYMSGRAGTPAA